MIKKVNKFNNNISFYFKILCFVSLLYPLATKAQPDSVKIGAYLTSLHDFNLNDKTFSAEIHIWCLYNNKEFNFEKELDIKNNNEVSYTGTSTLKIKNQYWFYTKALVLVRKNWETQNYPFDRQSLNLMIESFEYDKKDLLFLPDLQNTKLSGDLLKNLDDWVLFDSKVDVDSTLYDTNFGNSDYSDQSVFSKFNFKIELNRKASFAILFKLITGLLVAFIIAISVFFIKPINTDPRFGLCVGALFAAVGNKYIIEGIIPPIAGLSMLDQLHNLTFIFIIIIIISSIISLRVYEKGTEKAIKRSNYFDKIMFALILIAFVVLFSRIIIVNI